MVLEKTLSIIKPDINKISLVREIIDILEREGLKIVGMKIIRLTPKQAQAFYQEHQQKPFFEDMVKFMCSGPVVIMCLEGENAVKLNREIMGATDPKKAREGTIRKIYGKNIDANAIHGSDSPQAAEREIEFFNKL